MASRNESLYSKRKDNYSLRPTNAKELLGPSYVKQATLGLNQKPHNTLGKNLSNDTDLRATTATVHKQRYSNMLDKKVP